MEQFAIFLSWVSVFSVLIPIGIYLRYPSFHKISYIMAALIMVSLASDVANEIYVRAGNRGYLVLNLFYLIQFILLCSIYLNVFKDKFAVALSLMFFILFWLINTNFWQNIYAYQGNARILGNGILVIFSIACYVKISKKPFSNNKIKSLVLWFNMGVLYYFFCNLYLFAIGQYILEELFKTNSIIIWGLHSMNNAVKNLFFAWALFEAGRNNILSFRAEIN